MSEPERDVYANAAVIKHLGLKVGMLALLTVVLLATFMAYILHARGVFEPKQKLTLLARDASGVSVGMEMTFAGFPMGRVRDITLDTDGQVRIAVDVPIRQAHWLRERSQFLLERSLVGTTKLRMFSGDLTSPPLPDGAVRTVSEGDTAAEIPQIVATLKTSLGNIERLTDPESNLDVSIANLKTVTGRLAGQHGALEAALGNAENARKVMVAIDRANTLLGSLQGLTVKVDTAVGKADQRVLGPGGVLDQAQKAGVQLNAVLSEARESLRKVDAVLANAQVVSANAKDASKDLAVLRAEVDASLRKIGALIDEVNRKWPFERNTEMRLP